VVVGLNYAPETTGIAPYTTGLARHLAACGHEVTVVTGHPHYPEWRIHPGYETPRPPVHDAGVHLVRVRHPVSKDPTGPSRIWMEFVFAWRVGQQLLRRRPQAVIVVTPALLSAIPAVVLRLFKRYRLGVVVQDLYGAAVTEAGLGGGLMSRAVSALERFLLGQATGVLVIHEVFVKRLVAAGVPAERIEVVPNWTHITMPANLDRQAARAALGWAPDEFIALHTGNMGAKQGLEGLVDVARLAAKRGSRVRVVLVGNGSRRRAIQAYATDVPSLTILDSLPEGAFEAALAAADCLLLHEKAGVVEMAVPSKLTTYFTAGRPVVAVTDPRSGAASLIRASRAGITVPAGDAAVILDEIEALTGDQAAAEEMGRSGVAFAAEHLSRAASLSRQEAWVHSTLIDDGVPQPL
jgi:glycosyltransferase involved in cell wall biosynthesis